MLLRIEVSRRPRAERASLLKKGRRETSHGLGEASACRGCAVERGRGRRAAQAAGKPTRFLRVMVLLAAIAGRSSIEYLNEEDKSKPRTQQYKSYAELPIAFTQQPQNKDRGDE